MLSNSGLNLPLNSNNIYSQGLNMPPTTNSIPFNGTFIGNSTNGSLSGYPLNSTFNPTYYAWISDDITFRFGYKKSKIVRNFEYIPFTSSIENSFHLKNNTICYFSSNISINKIEKIIDKQIALRLYMNYMKIFKIASIKNQLYQNKIALLYANEIIDSKVLKYIINFFTLKFTKPKIKLR